MNTSYITLLYKENGKAQDNLNNYRPIAVLNSLYKILTRTITLAVNDHLHHIIDPDQHGFRPGKLPGNVILLLQSLESHCAHNNTSALIVSCDQSKAYDRMNWVWDYLQEVLASMRFPPGSCRCLIGVLA